MPATKFPAEFEDLLTAAGRRVLAGRAHAGVISAEHPFFIATDLVDAKKAARCTKLLDAALHPHLKLMELPVPPETITQMQANYDEWLPKAARQRTAYFERRTERAWRAAEEIGLIAMLKSESFAAFAAALSGRPLRRKWGIQALCYEPGDYVGPHNDHHPEEPEARDGYLDVHISLSNEAVAHQWIVYESGGHLNRIESIATMGGVTAYRLPVWHYTTPLVAKHGREKDARRWVLLGTFLFAPPRSRTAIAPPR